MMIAMTYIFLSQVEYWADGIACDQEKRGGRAGHGNGDHCTARRMCAPDVGPQGIPGTEEDLGRELEIPSIGV
jgi:hypothetical protein